MQLAQILNNLMESKSISAYKMSKDTGISDRLIGYWKKGEKLPSAENLMIISNYFGVSIDYLLTGENRKESNISQSAITTGDYSTSTVNIRSQETHSQQEDETVQEITRILNGLPLKERTKLLSMIYDFEEDYQKNSK
ncbi:MAG: helix-turn-helix domain-containing protein [Ruminococcus sp.]|nr:helix-turn-helix domain-containing protein [Ruminococcus sp.]MDD6110392.1 helix-turn-helix domain-containing protein [Ruminococcus sp.]MDD6586616.1 helix-turn-helix domain-containing protein [Ruminococcus sp.]